MLQWAGAGGLWTKAKSIKDLPEHTAKRLLNLHQSPFVEVGAVKSAVPAPDNKMLAEAEENKTAFPKKKMFGKKKR